MVFNQHYVPFAVFAVVLDVGGEIPVEDGSSLDSKFISKLQQRKRREGM